MEVLINFCTFLKPQILEYYEKTYKYIKDLLVYKEVELNATIIDKHHDEIIRMVDLMIKVTRVSLKTIGVPENRIKEHERQLNEIPNRAGEEYISVEDYFNDIKIILNKFLFTSVVDFLLDIDKNQLNTAELFGLLPNQFKEMINQYKALNIIDENVKNEILRNIQNIDQVIDLSIMGYKDIHEISKPVQEKKVPRKEFNFKNELEEFKKDISEIISPHLGTGGERIVQSPQENFFLFKETKSEEKTRELEREPIKPIKFGQAREELYPVKHVKLTNISETIDSFLDYYGKFPKIEPNIIQSLSINSVNLINSRVANPNDFLDLETLFYYIAILKMIGIGFPFSSIEIIEVAKNYINDNIFSSSKMDPSTPLQILHGIALFSELELLNRNDIIDIQKIRNTLMLEFEKFIPENLSQYFYSMVALKILERRGLEIPYMNGIIDRVIQQNLLDLTDYDPVTDIFNQLALIKFFKKQGKSIPSHFKDDYIKELKSLMQKNDSINGLITDSAKMLLIIDMLDLKEREKTTCGKIITYIKKNAIFFDSRTLNEDFNWKKHKLAYVLELRMLFWTLLACSQYVDLF